MNTDGGNDDMATARAAWLAYARDVVGDRHHRTECAAMGGSPLHPQVDASDLRWPGYLGASYARGRGALIVANSHTNFASGRVSRADRDRLVQATRGWRDYAIDDDTYLTVSRDVYAAGLHGWRIGILLSNICAELGYALDRLAYLNAARCQYPTVQPEPAVAVRTKLQLQSLCVRRFPTATLVNELAPRFAVFTSIAAYDDLTVRNRLKRVCINPLNATLLRELRVPGKTIPRGARRDEWLPPFAAAISRHGLPDE